MAGRRVPARIPEDAEDQRGGRDQSEVSVMASVGLLVRLHARPGKEDDVTTFLEGIMPLIREEPATIALLGVRFGPGEFGIVNVFPDEAGRLAHEQGQAAATLFRRSDELFVSPPSVEPMDVVSAKLPEAVAR
jgi:quinol monooxygenase YgiN